LTFIFTRFYTGENPAEHVRLSLESGYGQIDMENAYPSSLPVRAARRDKHGSRHSNSTIFHKETLFMLTGNYWKYGLAVGAGVIVGAIGAVLFSRGSVNLKKGCATLLSHGLDIKDQTAAMVETAKENIEDLATEARHEQAQRKGREQAS
jgi:hypothetical protein